MPRGRKKASANGRTGTGRINKMECVRQVMAELGDGVRPLEIQGALKDQFDLEMDTKMISTYKGHIQKKAAGQSAVRSSPVAVQSAPTSVQVIMTGGSGMQVEDVRAIKELADRLGAERVHELVEVLTQ